MRISIYIYTTVLTVALVLSSIAVWGQKYTPGELDELLAPIALYPDPLLAQIFPAATYLDQLTAASQFTGGTAAIDTQPWNVSVKAVAHYPEVLDMMVKNPDWTTAIGQAYVNQQADVLQSVQRLRKKAEANGNLATNDQQQVSTDNGQIVIVPAQPQYIYVPQYNPQVVYTEPAPSYGVSPWITFGTGLLIGVWLNNAINWNNHYVYYHGWHGGGWVNHARPYVNVHNNHYVNNKWANRPVPVNRGINNRNIQNYRRDVKRNVGTYRPPTRPGTTPGRKPSVPTTRPSIPKVPTTRPSVPGISPGAPGAGPGTPGVRPGTPTTRPGTPGVRPGTPTTRPGTPGVRPGTPTTRPSTPSVRPSTPTSRPSGGYRSGGTGSSRPTSRPSSGGAGRRSGGGGRRGK